MSESLVDHLYYLAQVCAIGAALAGATFWFAWRFRRSLSQLMFEGGNAAIAVEVAASDSSRLRTLGAPLVIGRITDRTPVEDVAAVAQLVRARALTRRVKCSRVLPAAAFWAVIVVLQVQTMPLTAPHLAWPLVLLHASLPGLMLCAEKSLDSWRARAAMALAYALLAVAVTALLGHASGDIQLAANLSLQLFAIHAPIGLGVALLQRRQLRALLVFLVLSVLFLGLPIAAIPVVLDALDVNPGMARGWLMSEEPGAREGIVLGVVAAALFAVVARLKRRREQPTITLVTLLLATACAGTALDLWLPWTLPNGALAVALPTLVLLGTTFGRLLESDSVELLLQRMSAEAFQWHLGWFCLAIFACFVLSLGGPEEARGNWKTGQSLAVAAYLLMLIASFALLHRIRLGHAGEQPKRLLLLRVFATHQKREMLLDGLDDSWRRVGRVDLLGGPDLAMRTLNASTWRCQLLGRLDYRFCRTQTQLERRLTGLHDRVDADVRFPINEIYCYSGVWQAAVLRLARQSDVVLLDLRGFRGDNTGCRTELAFLVHHVPLRRVLIVADRTSDELSLREAVHHAWRSLPEDSPNAAAQRATLHVLTAEGAGGPGAIARHLFVIAFGRELRADSFEELAMDVAQTERSRPAP